MKKPDFLHANTDSWKLKILVWLGQNWVDHSGFSTLKLAVSQEAINGINWFLVCWYKIRKAKSFFNNFWVVMVKNGRSILGLWTLKSAVFQEWVDEMGWFLACWYKFRKVKSCFYNYWVDMVKNRWGIADYGTHKSGVSHNWFDELSRLIEWCLLADSDGIVFVLMANLLCIFDI